MKIENTVEVDAPLDRVWALVNDIPRVAPCMPGAALTGVGDDGTTYEGTVAVKLGPLRMSYKGKVTVEDIDEANHSARLAASGKDTKGGGTARASVETRLEAAGDTRTRLQVTSDVQLTARSPPSAAVAPSLRRRRRPPLSEFHRLARATSRPSGGVQDQSRPPPSGVDHLRNNEVRSGRARDGLRGPPAGFPRATAPRPQPRPGPTAASVPAEAGPRPRPRGGGRRHRRASTHPPPASRRPPPPSRATPPPRQPRRWTPEPRRDHDQRPAAGAVPGHRRLLPPPVRSGSTG